VLDELKLEEEYMLAVTNSPQSNKLHLQRSYMQVYTIGAAIIEMLLEGQLRLNDAQKIEIVGFAATQPSRQPLMATIAAAKRPRKMKDWITHFMNHGGQRNTVFDALIASLRQSGLVSQEYYKILWIFPATRFAADTRNKDRVIQGLRAEMLEDGPISLQTSSLAMLLEASKQLQHYFSDYERREMQNRLKELQTEQSAEWKQLSRLKRLSKKSRRRGPWPGR
jgi:hypothetical protein